MRLAALVPAAVVAALCSQSVDALATSDTMSPCEKPQLVARFAVSRTFPEEGGVLPANRPVLIELTAPPRVPETPDQEVLVVTPKAFELSGGAVFGVTTTRSDYGTVRYLPSPMAEWAPTEWNDEYERKMLVQLQVFELLPDGTSKPGLLVPGQDYTFKMKVGAAAGADAYADWELHFTAGEAVGPGAAPVAGAYHSVVADSSCQEVHLDCSTATDCSVSCAQVGTLQKVSHTLSVDGANVPLSADDPWLLDIKLSDYGFSFRQLRFPEDDPASLGAVIDIFQSATDKGLTACATLTVSVPGGGPSVESDVACDTAEGVPDLCQGGPIVADPGPGETDAGHTPQDAGPGVPDTASVQDSGGVVDTSTAKDVGGSTKDTGTGGTIDDASFGDLSGDGSGGIYGLPGAERPVSDDNCGCDLAARRGTSGADGWLAALAAAGLWIALRRRSARTDA